MRAVEEKRDFPKVRPEAVQVTCRGLSWRWEKLLSFFFASSASMAFLNCSDGACAVTTLTQALYSFQPVRLSLFVCAGNNNTDPGFRCSMDLFHADMVLSIGHVSVVDYEIRILDTGVWCEESCFCRSSRDTAR